MVCINACKLEKYANLVCIYANMIDWNDIPFFIAVAECGTLSGAASKLAVNHSTVYRRINTLEDKLGTRLFHRLQDGYSLTDAGESVLEHALSVENSIHNFERIATGDDNRLSGKIVITAPSSSLASDYLAPCISQFQTKHPEIKIDIIVSDELQDLSKQEADLALRVTCFPPEFLVGRKICNITWDVYASKRYINKFGRPKSMQDLENHQLIGANGTFRHVPAYKCFNELYSINNYVCKASDLLTIHALCSQGAGIIILPSNYAIKNLVKLFKLTPSFDEQLWILMHPDLRNSIRVRAFSNHLYEYFKKQNFQSA